MDYTVHGILQVRILEWVAIPLSSGSSRPRDQTRITCVSCIGRGDYVKQVYRRGGTSDSNDWQVCTRQSTDGGATWGEWRRIDNGGDQRTVANTGYYKTADGLVFAWTRIGQTSANPAVVNKPIPFQTFIAQPVDVTTIDDDARAHQWISGETTNTTDTFKRNNNNDASTIFWVGKAV